MHAIGLATSNDQMSGTAQFYLAVLEIAVSTEIRTISSEVFEDDEMNNQRHKITRYQTNQTVERLIAATVHRRQY